MAAAKTGRRGTPKALTRPSRRAPAARPDPAPVRRRARANGHDVRDRGPVPAEVIAAYLAAGAPGE
ncbi:MAG: Lsr2 family protein [Frankiaceae bacterium]|nr:Lsr2 family protein [Frankiaceae bacterium]